MAHHLGRSQGGVTALAAHIRRRIAQTGPLTLADYMAECMLHPTLGYYTTRDPLGVAGDFITAPEISQMFGELIGLCLAQAWLDQGSPDPFVLAELGPGRGTLMADLWRATAGVQGFHAAARICLVEASAVLRAVQAKHFPEAQWCDTVAELPPGPLFLIANEFFDALPIRQFLRDGPGWRERVVGLLPDGKLGFGQTAMSPLAALAHRLEDTADGDIVETCAPATAIAATLGARLAARGGLALIIDYGDWRSLGDTFQALSGHARADPLEAPGSADLTAHVDFEALAKAAALARHSRLCPQGLFLERLGIGARAEALARNMSDAQVATLISGHRRLTHADEMGLLFKVMGLYPEGSATPPGLEA